ncbi:MAG TPA: carboxypeptidase regulatory-like domain-containing protein [Bryobacteraceae bacterium]|nr:carboxypeptidase regulatory-like domain-containing protein [Bryobacteraceae bacterium]
MTRFLFAFCCFLAISIPAWTQFELGSIVGLVTDPQKAPVAGAVVEIRSSTTNVKREALTTQGGEYNSLPLQPGAYVVTVRHPGFRERSVTLTVGVSQRLQADFSLELGNVSEQVSVSAAAATIETASSEIGQVRAAKEIMDLPLNTRNFTQLVQLAPGVLTGVGGASGLLGYTSGRGTNGAVINGAPVEDVTYLIDGINSVDTDAGVLIFFPPVDSIYEFKVQTSSAPAAYGGGQGIINVTYKSGTNELHGTAYEFLRNSALDAKNFFDSPTNPIPPFKLNQFGFNLGGPVVLPRVFNGKDRLFFFGDYEGKRVRQAQTFLSSVPIAAFRTGDFSALLPKTIVTDPRTKVPLPNNILPASAIDPTAARMIALYPQPNLPGQINNFLYNPVQTNRVDQFNLRADYRTSVSAVFGRFSWEDADTFNPGNLPEPAVGAGPGRPGRVVIPSKQAVLGYGRSLGATKYYEARVGYSRMFQGIYDSDTKYPTLAEDLGIPNANSHGAAPGLSTTNITGMTGLGDGAGSLQKINNNWEIDQALSWVRGRHELKFGFDYMSRRFAFFSPGAPAGQFTFSGIYSGFGLADFMFGRPISSRLDVSKFFSIQRFYRSWYLQDNWRVNSKLSVNMGLRNDGISAWRERHNRLAGFVPENGGNLVPVGTPPFSGDSVLEGRPWQLGPRLGLAYTITPKTVIRTGGGIFYSFKTVTSGNSLAKNAPFSGTLLTTNDATNYAAAKPISAGFPAERPELWPVQGTGFYYWPQDSKTSTMYEWNINVQRELMANMVLSVAYVGGKGTYVDVVGVNINQAVPGPGAVVSRRPYPNLSDATGVAPWGNSTYNSMQTTFERRMGVVRFSGAWTWAHSIDNTSGESSNSPIQNSRNLRAQRGNSTFDVRHKLTLSGTYELPFGTGKPWLNSVPRPVEWIAGGWQLNHIVTLQTGLPFTPTMQTSTLNTTGSQFPNRIASGKLPSDQRTIDRWFDAAAFVAPGLYTFGNSGRNILYGPGTKQLDLSLFKSFRFAEQRRVEFRAEAFNAFNTPQFNNPNSSIGFSGVGRITSAGSPAVYQRTSRQVQLALKIYF